MEESVKLLRLSGDSGWSLASLLVEHLLRLHVILVFIATLQVRRLVSVLHGHLYSTVPSDSYMHNP